MGAVMMRKFVLIAAGLVLAAGACAAGGFVAYGHGAGARPVVHCQREYGGQVGHAFHWRTICQ